MSDNPSQKGDIVAPAGYTLAVAPTLWVVTELYYPEETSTGYYMTRIAEGLTDIFNVKVLCGQPNYSARGVRAPRHETHNDVEIVRAGGSTLDKNVLLFRLINMLTLSTTIFFKSVFRFRSGDQVLVVTTPPSLPFIVALACLLKGAAYTLLIHDNYPELMIAAGKAREGSAFARVMNFFNRWLYKYAAKIIVVGRDMLTLIKAKTEGLGVPLTVIPNWAELETVWPEKREDNQLLAELGLLDKLIFLYAGNLGHPNDVETIIDAAEMLKDTPEIHFIFLGAGAKEPLVRNAVRERNLTNITMLAPRPRSEQVIFLNACDVALVSLVPKMRGVSMPSRTYNILAAGKPLLGIIEDDTELAQVIAEEDVGWCSPPGDAHRLLATIMEIYGDQSKLSTIGRRARDAALAKYSLATALDHYRTELVQPVLSRKADTT
jgi:colanic acid biosynthesis glycosyl transferase WcaI